jgi:hypothetical protein
MHRGEAEMKSWLRTHCREAILIGIIAWFALFYVADIVVAWWLR